MSARNVGPLDGRRVIAGKLHVCIGTRPRAIVQCKSDTCSHIDQCKQCARIAMAKLEAAEVEYYWDSLYSV